MPCFAMADVLMCSNELYTSQHAWVRGVILSEPSSWILEIIPSGLVGSTTKC